MPFCENMDLVCGEPKGWKEGLIRRNWPLIRPSAKSSMISTRACARECVTQALDR